MGLRDVLAAKARGEIPTKDLVAFGRAGSDAYDLLDQVPASGYARLCAWNAFVLQTYGDKLLAALETPGFASPETVDHVATLYQYVGGWLIRARQAAANTDYRLDVYVPQGLPHWQTTQLTRGQLTGMRDTLQTAQARLVSDLSSFAGEDDARARLKSLGVTVDSEAEYLDKLWTSDPGVDLRTTLGTALQDGLERAYRLGQVMAVPALLDELQDPASSHPRLPGDSGFDPWCLTDPMERRRLESDAAYRPHLDSMWKADPHPERTLGIKAEIDAALASGAIDYMPLDSLGPLGRLAEHCPWPGVLFVKTPVQIGGKEIEPGERFVFAVSNDDGKFERAVVVAPANEALPDLNDAPSAQELAAAELVALFGRRRGFRVTRL